MITNNSIREKLENLSEESYKIFNKKIVSTNYKVLGIRIPVLRSYAKELAKDCEVTNLLKKPDLNTYESFILYGMVVAHTKGLSLDTVFNYLDPIIPQFDNWAHVDCIVSELKIFKSDTETVLQHYMSLKYDEGEFTKRFFVILLLSFYMNDKYIDSVLHHLTEISQGQYYVDMAIAWTLSVGLVKYYEKTLNIMLQQAFSKFVHNKAIQKARESLRIDAETKEYLNTLKIK